MISTVLLEISENTEGHTGNPNTRKMEDKIINSKLAWATQRDFTSKHHKQKKTTNFSSYIFQEYLYLSIYAHYELK